MAPPPPISSGDEELSGDLLLGRAGTPAAMSALVIAYKIAAGEGSESGSGYNFVKHIREHVGDLTVITRCDQAEALVGDPAVAGVKFVGYDVPRMISWWKRRHRGVMPYYYLWQLGVGRAVARMHARQQFNIVHQWNFHTDWAPHFLHAPQARIIWGPVCHQPQLPMSYLCLERLGGPVREFAKVTAKRAFWHLDPALRSAIRRTDVAIYANRDVASPFHAARDLRFQTFAMGGFMGQVDGVDTTHANSLKLIHVGRMVSIKGAAVALEALSRVHDGAAANAQLEIVGDGPLRERLVEHARQLRVLDRVTFTAWMAQADLARRYRSSDALLYPSLANQDSVVAEALAGGLPVIGVESTGTEMMAGTAGLMAPRRPHSATVDGLAAAIALLATEKRVAPATFAARKRAATLRSQALSWRQTAADIADIYSERRG